MAKQSTNRRDALKLMAAGLAGMATTLPADATTVIPFEFPHPGTGQEALNLLLQGNQRYLAESLTSCSANFAKLRHETEVSQEPYAAILSCADSRVPAEIVFDQTLGELFVIRVAGNIATSDTIASLEYAAEVLKVKLILVMGHTNCGAIKAASLNKPVPGQISTLFQYMSPAIKGAPDLTEASRRSAIFQANILRDASPVLANLVATGALLIRTALYDVVTGKVIILER